MPGAIDDVYVKPRTTTKPTTPTSSPTWWTRLKNLDQLNKLGTPMGVGGGGAPVPNFNTEFNQPATYMQEPPAPNGGSYAASPSWWEKAKERLKLLGTPTGLGGGGAPVPNFNTQFDQPYRQPPNYRMPTSPDTYNAAPSIRTDPVVPVGSFLGGGGQYALGPNQRAYYIGQAGPNSFIGGGGQAVRGPDSGIPSPPSGGGGGGGDGGFGSRYKGFGRGGGYGGGYGGYGGYEDIPRWLMGLYSWNFKG